MSDPGPSKRKRTESPVDEAADSSPGRKRARTEPSDECYIHLLPEEILCIIFNLLSFQQQKHCAEVCHRWYGIFRTKPYLRRMKMRFSHCFGFPINQFDRQRMSTCLNCLMSDCGVLQEFFTPEYRRFREVLYDNPSDVDCPIVTAADTLVEDFLFSGDLPVESIRFATTFERAREHIGERLEMLRNLTELIFALLPPGRDWDVEDSDPEWVIGHPNVTALTLQTYIANGPYRLEFPSLKDFVHEISNDWDLTAMRTVSAQLERLDVKFYFPRAIEQTFTYPFPRLRQLTMKRYGDNKTGEPNTRVDDMSAERFIKSMPLLQEVELRCTIITMKAFRAVCLFSPASLTRLTLLDIKFSRSLFLHLLELVNLQYLKLKLCSIVDGGRIHNVAFPELRHMVMINSGTCIRIDRGLSNIRTFRYTMDMQLPKVCRFMGDLEDFEIKFRTNYPIAEDVRDYFHHLPTLSNLRVLRLSGIKTNTRPWQFVGPMPAVERLVLRKCHLARCDFKLLPTLFPSIKVLELDGTIIAYKRHPKGVDPLRYFEGRLKGFFPGVWVLCKDCQAVPLPTVLEMEDEYRWRLKEIEETNFLDIQVWSNEYNRQKYNRHKWSTAPVHLSKEDILPDQR